MYWSSMGGGVYDPQIVLSPVPILLNGTAIIDFMQNKYYDRICPLLF